MKVPNWTREEMILACRVAHLHEWEGVDTGNAEVKKLSDLLRTMWREKLGSIEESDLSVGSVSRKINNLIAHTTPGKGLRTSRNEKPLVDDFINHTDEMIEEAKRIELDFQNIAMGVRERDNPPR